MKTVLGIVGGLLLIGLLTIGGMKITGVLDNAFTTDYHNEVHVIEEY